MDKKIRITFIVLILTLIIIVGILIAYDILKGKNTQEVTNNGDEIGEDIFNDLVFNNITEELINNLSNNINIANSEVPTETTPKTPPDIIVDEQITNEEQKAIDIVKQDWGEDDTVYFSKVGIDSSGRYIISVNNRYTTAAIMWYTVDINTGKFFKQ